LSDQKLNVLIAYPYLKSTAISHMEKHASSIRFLLDSGAFTAWKAGKPIPLEDYCGFLGDLPFRPWKYFMLDVIGDPHATMRNYEQMLARGLDPIPIFTRGEDPDQLETYFKTTDVVGVGGLVQTERNKGFVKGIMQKIGKRHCHWLGFTNLDFIKTYRPFSCDSSSWAGGVMYGRLSLFHPSGRFINLGRADLNPQLEQKLEPIFAMYGESMSKIREETQWRNIGRYQTLLQRMSYKSWSLYQHMVEKKTGTKMFLAVTAEDHLSGFIRASQFWREKGVMC
jgi:hypothetical protein